MMIIRFVVYAALLVVPFGIPAIVALEFRRHRNVRHPAVS